MCELGSLECRPQNTVTNLTRAEIEKVVEPIIRRSLRELEFTRAGVGGM